MNLLLAVSGASGAYAAELLITKSPWPVDLIVSRWGADVYRRECGDVARLKGLASRVFDDADLAAPVSRWSSW